MSAIREREPKFEKNGKKSYYFAQTVPIPAYLIAIAAGNLESREIGPRSQVWSEPQMIEKAKYEFAEVPKLWLRCRIILRCRIVACYLFVRRLNYS